MLTMGDDLFAALTRLQAGLDSAFEVQGMVAHRRRRLKCFDGRAHLGPQMEFSKLPQLYCRELPRGPRSRCGMCEGRTELARQQFEIGPHTRKLIASKGCSSDCRGR